MASMEDLHCWVGCEILRLSGMRNGQFLEPGEELPFKSRHVRRQQCRVSSLTFCFESFSYQLCDFGQLTFLLAVPHGFHLHNR